MQGLDWWIAVGGGIAGILSLIFAGFSATAAAKSADIAEKAEQRAAAADKRALEAAEAGSARERNRVIVAVKREVQAAHELLDRVIPARHALSAATGGRGGSREKLTEDEVGKRRQVVQEAEPQDAWSVEQLDTALTNAKAERAWAQEALEGIERERQTLLARMNAPRG